MITSRDNDYIKEVIKLQKSAKHRKQKGLYVAEGARLCGDAVLSNAEIKRFFYTADAKSKYSDSFDKIFAASREQYEVDSALFAKMTDTKSPQGFLCIISMLDKPNILDKIENKGCYIALENIQDPSNLGTILRTTEALGIDGVILSDDCCDIYSPKVIRGSMGAVFRIKFVIKDSFTDYISELTQNGINTYAATPRDAVPVTNANLKSGVVLIGNEGAGLTDGAINACSQRIMIPMLGRAESLNAASAAGILMWELVR